MSRSITFHSSAVRFVPSPVSSRGRLAPSDQDSSLIGSDAIRKQIAAAAEAMMLAQVEQFQTRQAEKCRQCGAGFNRFLEKMKEEIADQVVNMSVKLAEIIVRHQLPDREMIKEVLRHTLDPISDLHGARVRLHPSDAGTLKNGSDASPMAFSDRIEIVSDSSLDVGDLVIESRNGIFDARLTERLSLLKESLMDRRGKSHANHG
jgi:flagellar biosynthesis/type III secretory pathway protein FliH